MDNWIIPLTLLPRIGMMIMSTSNLSTAISDEINALLHEKECNTQLVQVKISQMSLLNIAMVCLYISTSVFAIAGLVGGISDLQNIMIDLTYHHILVIIGIATLVLATILLMIFSVRSVKIKRNQYLKSISKS